MKIVLTGGPCSGKSTLAGELERRGFGVVRESAEEVLRKYQGGRVDEIDPMAIQREIIERQILIEKNIPREGVHFLDRSLLDCLVYGRKLELDVSGVVDHFNPREMYDRVLFFERLPFKQEGFRIECDDFEAREMHELLRSAYEEHFDVISIPAFVLCKRVNYVLETLELS